MKLRLGWKEDETNVAQVARACEESGAAAITIHGRTREQRYSRAADWDAIGRVAAERSVPVIGNGDILTHYEARERHGALRRPLGDARRAARSSSPGCFARSARAARWLPSPEERFAVLWRFVELLREHFGVDERGVKRTLRFLPWHLNFFCRYLPLPEEQYREPSLRAPAAAVAAPGAARRASPLERLLGDARPELHQRLAEELLASATREEALERALRLAAGSTDVVARPGARGGCLGDRRLALAHQEATVVSWRQSVARFWTGPGGGREVALVAYPLILGHLSFTIQTFVDRLFLTWYSAEAVAGAVTGLFAVWSLIALFTGTGEFLTTFVAQYLGAGRRERIGAAIWQGIYFSIGAGVLIALLSPLAGPVFDLAAPRAAAAPLRGRLRAHADARRPSRGPDGHAVDVLRRPRRDARHPRT